LDRGNDYYSEALYDQAISDYSKGVEKGDVVDQVELLFE
jgi:hypothetical protein